MLLLTSFKTITYKNSSNSNYSVVEHRTNTNPWLKTAKTYHSVVKHRTNIFPLAM